MKAQLEGVKCKYAGGYLSFSEEVEGEVGIYYAGKRLRDYNLLKEHPMLALYTVYIGDQARYLNYFKKENSFKGDTVRINPLYGGYILNDSEEGVVFGRCVKINNNYIMPLTDMKLCVEAKNNGHAPCKIEYGEKVNIFGDYSVKVRRCIFDAGIDVTEKVDKSWKPVRADSELITFRKGVMGIPDEIRKIAVEVGKLKILSDVSFALSEIHLMLKKGFRTRYKVKLSVFPAYNL